MKKFEELKTQYKQIKKNNIVGDYSDLLVSSITADFDRLFELVWNTLKEYMGKELGLTAAKTGSPRTVLGLAYQYGLLKNENAWVQMLNDRNDDTHIYSQTQAVLYKSRIEYEYLPFVEELISDLAERIPEEKSTFMRFPEKLIKEAEIKGIPIHKYVDFMMKQRGCTFQDLLKSYDEEKGVIDGKDKYKL